MSDIDPQQLMSRRFRGFLPVIVDVETGGFNAKTDALLEIAAVTVVFDENGKLQMDNTYASHVQPFPGANMDEASLAFTGIDPHHPFRFADSELDALKSIFEPVRKAV
ncbi:MAG: exonuclease domain-containing protein, partial [Gammaproteobacteria bacterium]